MQKQTRKCGYTVINKNINLFYIRWIKTTTISEEEEEEEGEGEEAEEK